MQKATFAITIPHFSLPISAYISEVHHESSIQSITSRFKSNETFQYTHRISLFTIMLLFKVLEKHNVFVVS